MRVVAVFGVVLVLAGCVSDGAAVTTSTTVPPTTTGDLSPSTLPPVVECPGIGDFAEGRGIADIDGTESDTRRLGRISWDTSDQCESFRFEFETSEAAPSTSPPDVRVDHLESFQVIRISLDVDSTIITDQVVETNLVDRLYVVRSLTGELFVDLHLTSPAAVRVSSSSSPARLSVDLRPGFVPFSGEATVGENVVLTSPTAGAEVGPSAQLLGYARTFEASVLAVATQDGRVVAEADTIAADSFQTWGEYRLSVTTLPPGPLTLFVGESNPADGSLDGITVDLTGR
jgi:hypothetical protein